MHGVPQPADRGRDRGASRGFDRSRSRDLDRGSRPRRGYDDDRDGRSFDRRDDDRAAAPPRPPPRCPPPGTLIDGVVDRVRACGAFVRVPGDFSDGLLPTSQQDQTARPGDRIRVRVMDNKGAEKWSCTTRDVRTRPPLSERAGVPSAPAVADSRNDQHPASQAGAGAERTDAGATAGDDAPAVEEGGIYAGACSKVAPYGAFVSLDRGGEGLLHRSKCGTDATGARRVPAKGDRLFVRVLQIMDDGKVAFSTLGLDAATGLPDDGAIAIEIDVGANDGKAEKKFGPGDIPGADERVTLVEALRGFFRECSSDEDHFDGVCAYDDTCSTCHEAKEVYSCEACNQLFCAECIGQNGYDDKQHKFVKVRLPSARTKKTTREWLYSHDPCCPFCTHPW